MFAETGSLFSPTVKLKQSPKRELECFQSQWPKQRPGFNNTQHLWSRAVLNYMREVGNSKSVIFSMIKNKVFAKLPSTCCIEVMRCCGQVALPRVLPFQKFVSSGGANKDGDYRSSK